MNAARLRSLVPLPRLCTAARSGNAAWDELDWATPVDLARPFLCETLTPLYYTPSYPQLSPRQRLRYNQIVGMSCNEIITFFEESLAGTVLTALAHHPLAEPELRENLRHFQAEEAEHTAIFRRLNQLAAPDWYHNRTNHIVRPGWAVRQGIKCVGQNAAIFPFILWLMLAMEERSLEMSRRCAALGPNCLEPRFAMVYGRHMRDEARHVQIDWHLIERFHDRLPRPLRRFNAHLLAGCIRGFLLTPRAAGRRVLQALAAEFPELAPRLPEMNRQLAALVHHSGFHATVFSPAATPIMFQLFDQRPEFRRLQRTLLCYEPAPGSPEAA